MGNYLKEREREKKLEKIRGKAKNGNGRGTGTGNGDGRKLRAELVEYYQAAYKKGLYSYSPDEYTIVFEIDATELERFPELRSRKRRNVDAKIDPHGVPYIAFDEKTWREVPFNALGAIAGDDEHNTPHNLWLYIGNTSELYKDVQGVRAALVRNRKAGKYKSAPALRLFEQLAEKGARQYGKEFRLRDPFTKPVRKRAALYMLEDFEGAVGSGEWDYLA